MSRRCRHYGMITCHIDGNGAARMLRCPSNTNKDTCQIIPAKSKYKTIKGWAIINSVGAFIMADLWKTKSRVPCEIRINTKYLKGRK